MDWDNYGVDWESPIPLFDNVEESIVTVEEFQHLLTDFQREALRMHVQSQFQNIFSQKDMISFYINVRTYIRNFCM